MNERRLTKPRLVPAVFATFLLSLTALHTAPAIAEEPGAALTLTEIDPPLLNKADPPAFREATID